MLIGELASPVSLDGKLHIPQTIFAESDHRYELYSARGGMEADFCDDSSAAYITKSSLGFDGSSYILTDYCPDSQTVIEVEFSKETTSYQAFVFGSRTSAASADCFAYSVGTVRSYPLFGLDRSSVPSSPSSGDRHQAIFGSEGFVLDGEVIKEFNEPELVSNIPLAIGGLNVNGSIDDRLLAGSIFSVRIIRNGTVVREYIPASRVSDGAEGMYELCSKSFLPLLSIV